MKMYFKEKALELRRNGLAYSEILENIPVAKSTLSLWLQSVNLSEKQKQRLSERKISAMRRGWAKRKQQRLDITLAIKKQAHKEIGTISENELLLMGIMLYWAEGAKSKDYNISQGVIFGNSDSAMIKIFLKWLKDCAKVTSERIVFEIYIHESSLRKQKEIKQYWAGKTGFPIEEFDRIYLKKDKIKTNRRNKGNAYYGLLRVKVKKSTNLNRKISAWIETVVEKCGVV